MWCAAATKLACSLRMIQRENAPTAATTRHTTTTVLTARTFTRRRMGTGSDRKANVSLITVRIGLETANP